jgi:hypothetical protein
VPEARRRSPEWQPCAARWAWSSASHGLQKHWSMSRHNWRNHCYMLNKDLVTSYAKSDQLKLRRWSIEVKGLTLSACLAIRCICLPRPGGGPSGRGSHMAQSLKDFTCQQLYPFYLIQYYNNSIFVFLFTFR